MHLGFEANYLCLHRDDVAYRLIANCVWIEVPDREDTRAFSDRYVVVQGVSRAVSGEKSMIEKVRRIVEIEESAPKAESLKGRGR